jgi:signal transduction histidine kinase
LNIKQKDFLISNTIVVVFTVLLTLIIYNFLTVKFGFNQDTFYPITFVLLLFASIFYYLLSKSLLKPLFKSEKEIQNLIKETLHEINTPVATIKMNTKILQKKEENSKNLDRLQRIEQSCDNLLELYKQMEYSLKEKIDNITVESFDIDEIILKSLDKFKDIKKDIQINYTSETLIIETDKNGFEKVIDNLISNAIKYNKPNGEINISLENNTLKIKDTGIGIDTKNLFHVFDKYYQEDSLNSGVGLGLNIVKAYCDNYKIDLKIDSTKDVGSEFSLDLKGIIWQQNK